MALGDIQRLRQQYVFSPTEDISGGGMGYDDYGSAGPDYGPNMDYGGGGSVTDTSQNPFERPPSSMPAEASSGQAGMGAPQPIRAPSYDPNASIDATMNAINRVYTPENVDRDRLRALMDAAPERQAPSFGRSLVAAGLSLKAADPIATSEKVLYAPHYRNMADWTAKADPFLKTAELENRANINERTLAGNVATSVTAAERLAENARQADQKNEVANIRAAAYKLKQERYEIKVEGDSVVGYGPHNERVILGPSGGLDAADKINLEGKWNVAAAEARGEAGVKIAQAGGVARGEGTVIGADGKAYRLNPEGTMYVPVPGLPKGTPNKLANPPRPGATNTLETRRQINDQLKSDYQTSPDAKKFIKRKSDETYDFADRPQVGPATGVWPFNNKDAVTPEQVEQYDQYRKSVDPSYVPPATKPGGIGGSMGSGKEELPAAGKGLAPRLAPGASVGTGYGGYTPTTASPQYEDIDLPAATKDAPHKVVGQVSTNPDPVRRQLEQRAIGYLSKNNLPVTAANIEYAIKTGRLAR